MEIGASTANLHRGGGCGSVVALPQWNPARSAYSVFLRGREQAHCASEILSAGAPLVLKLHMWLAQESSLDGGEVGEAWLAAPRAQEDGDHLLVQCVFVKHSHLWLDCSLSI